MSTPTIANNIQIESVINPQALTLETDATSGKSQIRKNGSVVGDVSLSPQSKIHVRIYEGKGGLSAVLTSPSGLRYIVLPGGEAVVDGAEVRLQGDKLAANPQKRLSISTSSPQKVTPQATILGAGLATRFEPVSGDTTHYAKPSVPLVGEKSVIACIVESIARHGFKQIFINTFFKADSLKASLANPPGGATVQYLDENKPSGTAGGLRKALENAEHAHLLDPTQPVLVVQGDAVTDADFSSLMEAHVQNNAALTIGCQIVSDDDVDKFGIVETDQSGADGKSGKIIGFMEKPSLAQAGPHRMGSTGFYIFSPEAFPIVKDVYKAKGNPELLDFAKDIFPEVLKRAQAGEIKNAAGQSMPFWAEVVNGYWSDIGNAVQYVETMHDIHAGKVNLQLPFKADEYYDNGIIYWPGAKALATQEGAALKGNVIVARPFSP